MNYRNQPNQPNQSRFSNLSIKKLFLTGLAVVAGLILSITFLTAWEDVNMGEEGFIYRPYSGGLTVGEVYTEGTYFVAPWNKMVKYNIRQQTKSYVSKVMDKNSTEITSKISVSYSASKGTTPQLHLRLGPDYITFIDDKARGAIKDVIGRYTYEELVSTKREFLENEIEHILNEDFKGHFVNLNYVEIADIDLPGPIADEIVNKETQKQRNLTAQQTKLEEQYLADARIEKARGDSSLVISATYKALAIRQESDQINRNPAYIEYIKWKGFADGKGSPYGTNNVFGSGVNILKGQ